MEATQKAWLKAFIFTVYGTDFDSYNFLFWLVFAMG